VTTVDTAVLDDPTWAALTGPHADFAERVGNAVRYPVDVSPFSAVSDQADPSAWADLAKLVGPGETATLPGLGLNPPAGWEVIGEVAGVQMVATTLKARDEPSAVELGPADVPDMLDLVERTRPGPFRERTLELGTYLGIRRNGRLIAMAGERLRVPGWTEISAVCTDPEFRGQGLAGRLVLAVAAGIRRRGDTPFLHTGAHNETAISLYRTLGFTIRARPVFRSYRVPD
jgi:ribosomal protein S18 acetylase RimI-like enzyme